MKQDTLEQVKQKEQELRQMEASLYDYYYEAGKTLLEAAEAESERINVMVDQIVEMRIAIAEMRRQNEENTHIGHADTDGKYCRRCGQLLKEREEILDHE